MRDLSLFSLCNDFNLVFMNTINNFVFKLILSNYARVNSVITLIYNSTGRFEHKHNLFLISTQLTRWKKRCTGVLECSPPPEKISAHHWRHCVLQRKCQASLAW